MLIVISNKTFSQMQSYKTLDYSQDERQQLKYTFMDRIKEQVSVRWNRAKKLLRVIDEIIYKATDRGYSFNGRETLADICEVGLSTVDTAIRVLKESGEVIVAYRENPASNGYKTPVIILKNHPHFSYWKALLKLEQDVKQKVENAEKSCESKDEQPKIIPTYLLSTFLNNNHLNTRRNQYIKYVPKLIQHFQSFFGKDIKDIYSRVWLAAKKLGVTTDQETMQQIGYTVMEQLKRYVKEGKQFTKEQLCKLAYKIGYNQLQQGIERGEIVDRSSLYAIVENARMIKLIEKRNTASHKELDEMGVY